MEEKKKERSGKEKQNGEKRKSTRVGQKSKKKKKEKEEGNTRPLAAAILNHYAAHPSRGKCFAKTTVEGVGFKIFLRDAIVVDNGVIN